MTTHKSHYHHGDLASALMDAAIKRIAQAGVDKLSLRAVARDLGVSQTALYRHFNDKNHLLNVLAKQGFERLTDACGKAASEYLQHTNRAMMALGMAYVKFAQQNPEHYRLMFGGVIKRDCADVAVIQASLAAFNVILKYTRLGVQRGDLTQQDPLFLARSCWAKVHGMTMLLIDGFYAELTATQLDDLLRKLLWVDLRGISARPLPAAPPQI